MPKKGKKNKGGGKKAGKGSGGKATKKGKGAPGGKGKKKKGAKKKKKKKKKKDEEVAPVVMPVLDPYAIRTQCLRQRSCLDISHGRSREGRLYNVIIDSLVPPLRFWSHLREIRIWGHGASDAKRLAVALHNAKSRSRIDTLCLRSNQFGRWNAPRKALPIDNGVEGTKNDDNDIPTAEEVVLPDEMTDPLAVILMLPGLTSLDLSCNYWSPSEEFAAVLHSKPNLRVLHLNNNKMGSTGLGRLLDAFPPDSKIEELGISKNDIGPSGGGKLAQVLNVHSSHKVKPETAKSVCPFKHLQILNASGNLFGPAEFELGEALTFRPNVSILMGNTTLNKENYNIILRDRASHRRMVSQATCYICRFFRRVTKQLKQFRLAKEAAKAAELEAATKAEEDRLKAEKAAAKAAKKKAKKGKKGKKGKKDKKGAGPSKKKGGKKDKSSKKSAKEKDKSSKKKKKKKKKK